ncbi:hypothetical protein SNEBB_004594 [Seison nebaliae]|nr:hypothetical protein SNEBB_004594 [Seison nebaliae]
MTSTSFENDDEINSVNCNPLAKKSKFTLLRQFILYLFIFGIVLGVVFFLLGYLLPIKVEYYHIDMNKNGKSEHQISEILTELNKNNRNNFLANTLSLGHNDDMDENKDTQLARLLRESNRFSKSNGKISIHDISAIQYNKKVRSFRMVGWLLFIVSTIGAFAMIIVGKVYARKLEKPEEFANNFPSCTNANTKASIISDQSLLCSSTQTSSMKSSDPNIEALKRTTLNAIFEGNSIATPVQPQQSDGDGQRHSTLSMRIPEKKQLIPVEPWRHSLGAEKMDNRVWESLYKN